MILTINTTEKTISVEGTELLDTFLAQLEALNIDYTEYKLVSNPQLATIHATPFYIGQSAPIIQPYRVTCSEGTEKGIAYL